MVSGVPGIPGAIAGEPGGCCLRWGTKGIRGRGTGVDGVFGAPAVPGESR